MTELRKHPVLEKGIVEIVDVTNSYVLFLQRTESEIAYIGVNMSEEAIEMPIPQSNMGYHLQNRRLASLDGHRLLPNEVGVWFASSVPSTVVMKNVRFEKLQLQPIQIYL